MRTSFFIILFLFLIPNWLLAGVTGKLSGLVIDKDTGEALPGVNVVIQGTDQGAATDVNGFYIILNIPVGYYAIKAQHIGFKTVSVSKIRIHNDLTTNLNFELEPAVIEGEMISIVAKRPIINKNVTHSIKTIQAEDLENIPLRGINTAMNLSSAVVMDENRIHVRGGRFEENVTYVDGVMTSILRGGMTNGLSLINRSIEEVSFHAGGFNAEYGFAMSGILLATTKSGGSDYHFSFEGISDEVFQSQGKTLGTRSWGYNTYTLTASGPVPGILNKKLRFFLAGERNYVGGNATFWEGIQFDTVLTSHDRDYHFKADYGPGSVPGFFNSTYDINGNLVYSLPALRFRFGGTYHLGKNKEGAMWGDIFNLDRITLYKNKNTSSYLNITHQVKPKLFYTLNLSYFFHKNESGDPVLWDDIRKYGDPEYNMGPDGQSALRGWGQEYIYNLFGFIPLQLPGEVNSFYRKTVQSNYGGKFDLVWQFNNFNELKTGIEYNYFTVRRYNVNAPSVSLGLHNRSIDPSDTRTDYDFFRNRMFYYGYDLWGNEIESDQIYLATNNQNEIIEVNGHDAPKHPVRAAFYIQDKIELRDMVFNAGLRVDYFATGTWKFDDATRLTFNSLGLLSEEHIEDQNKFWMISPRLGWSFPVTDRTVFHAQFGKFVQMPRMVDLYIAYNRWLERIGYQNPDLKPQSTIQYEVGFKQRIGNNASLNVVAFYKDVKNQIQQQLTIPAEGFNYPAANQVQNLAFGSTMGFTVNLNLRRTKRVQASIDYTYSKARGTNSYGYDQDRTIRVGDLFKSRVMLVPLRYNQDHVANFNIDFRLTENDGPSLFNIKPFANIGVNLYYIMHSGLRFTRFEPGPLGLFTQVIPGHMESPYASQMPWYHRLDLKIDKTIRLGRLSVKPYAWIYNVLNRKNVIGVYPQTGDPHNNGWFLTEDGKLWQEINGERGMYYAQKYLSGSGARNIGTPRVLRFGLLAEF